MSIKQVYNPLHLSLSKVANPGILRRKYHAQTKILDLTCRVLIYCQHAEPIVALQTVRFLVFLCKPLDLHIKINGYTGP